jgi:protein associated with RNAse G/E
MADAVRVVYTKFDGSLHWHHTMHSLGEDEHGIWLGAPAGMIARRGHDGPEVVAAHPQVMLFPRGVWWTAVFNGEPSSVEIYCDITTPATWPQPGEVTMVDLDLDVIRERADGAVKLLDEDEFQEHQIGYGYPPDVIASASQSAAWLMTAVSESREPFSSTYRGWLGQLAG